MKFTEIAQRLRPYIIQWIDEILGERKWGTEDTRDLGYLVLFDSSRNKKELYEYSAAGLIAANAAAGSGDVVYIPPGTITLTSAIVIAAGAAWEGESVESTIISASGEIDLLISAGDESTISDLTVNFTSTSASETVAAIDITYSRLRNIQVKVTSGTAQNLYGVYGEPFQNRWTEGEVLIPAIDNVHIDINGCSGTVDVTGAYLRCNDQYTQSLINDVSVGIANNSHTGTTRGLSLVVLYGSVLYRTYVNDVKVYIYANSETSSIYGISAGHNFDFFNCHIRIDADDADNVFGWYLSSNYKIRLIGCSSYVYFINGDGDELIYGVYCAADTYETYFDGCSFIVEDDASASAVYGLSLTSFDANAYNCVFSGSDADIRIDAVNLNVYSCQYDTTSLPNGGTITMLPGDRAGLANDSTFTGDNIFSGDNLFSGESIFDGALIFNDSQGNVDLKASTQNEEYMLFVDASADTVLFGGTVNGVQINSGGDLKFIGSGSGLPFGSMYTNAAIATTMTLQNTFYEIDAATAWITGPLNQCTFSDPKITATNAGIYQITWNLSGSVGTASQVLNFGIMVDSTTVQNQGRGRIDYRLANRLLNTSGTAIVTLTAGQTVSLAVRNVTSAARVYTVQNGNLSITMIGA